MDLKKIANEQKNKRIQKLVEYWKPILEKKVKNNARNGYNKTYILLDNRAWFRNVQIFSDDIKTFILLLKKDVFFDKLTIKYEQDATPMFISLINVMNGPYEHPFYLIIEV